MMGAIDSARAETLKIGLVDMQRALAESSAGKEAQKKYEVEVKKAQEGIDKKKEDFEQKQKAYQKQKGSLSDKAKTDREEELMRSEREIKRTFQDSQEQLRRRNASLVGDLVQKLKKVVEDYAKDEGYDLILEKSGPSVLFSNDKGDVTDEVVKRFDKE